MDTKPVTVRQAAALLGVTQDAIRKRVKRGLIQYVRDEKGHLLVYVQAIPGQDSIRQDITQTSLEPVACQNCIKLMVERAALTAQNEALAAQIKDLQADRDAWKAHANDIMQQWKDKQLTEGAPRGLWARLRDAIKPHKE